MNTLAISRWSNEDKLKSVITRAAKLLPGEVGNALLALATPAAIATMVGVLVVWAGSHFLGAGFVADIVLLTVGAIALGGVAIEAGYELFQFGKITLDATSDADLDQAAQHLASAISLIGVQAVLAILLRQRPATFKTPYSKAKPLAPLSKMGRLPRTPGLLYKPKLTFTNKKIAGEGRTNAAGDILLGRDRMGNTANKAAQQMRLAAHHEKVHQFLTPKLQVFREIPVYIKQNAYQKSYILRYLEEALAEVYSQCRVYGLGTQYILNGLKFPLGGYYEITIALLGTELRGIILGPIAAGGMTYLVAYGARTEEYEPAR